MIPDYDQYNSNKLHDENRQLYFDNKQLYDKNMGIFSETEWLKEECRRFEREMIQLRHANEQFYIDNKQLKYDHESIKRKLISDMSYLQYCLEDRDKTVKDLDKHRRLLMDEKDDIERGLENKNTQLGHDLAKRSKEYLEQTVSLEAKIDEKEYIIRHLEEAIEEYFKL
jgi:FtsZ-binding cell division protein ZapB